MSVANTVKALLRLKGKRQADLADHFNMKPQSMTNKMSRDSFSADDLIKVAEFTGCRVAFVLDDGQMLFLDSGKEDEKNPQD